MKANVIPDRPADKPKPRLLDQVREVLRFKHYSIRTERCYADWILRFILFDGKRHPDVHGSGGNPPISDAPGVRGQGGCFDHNRLCMRVMQLACGMHALSNAERRTPSRAEALRDSRGSGGGKATDTPDPSPAQQWHRVLLK